MADGCVADTPWVDLALVGAPKALQATPIASPRQSNGLDLRSDGIYVQVRGYGSALPASPFNGLEYLLDVDDATKWGFVYDAGSAFDYRWVYTGGTPILSERIPALSYSPGNANGWVLGSGAAGDVAGPDVVAPVTARYRIRFGALVNANGDASISQVGVSINGADPTDDSTASNANTYRVSVGRTIERQVLAGQRIRLMYRSNVSGGTLTISERWLEVHPTRAA